MTDAFTQHRYEKMDCQKCRAFFGAIHHPKERLLPPHNVDRAGITVTWSPNSEQVDGYILYIESGQYDGRPFTSPRSKVRKLRLGNITSMTIELEPNIVHKLALTAYNGNIESNKSRVITFYRSE